MKYGSVFLIGIGFWAHLSAAGTPPSQDVVDQYITAALSIDPVVFEGRGKHTCKSISSEEPELRVSADSIQKASQLLLLKCIRFQCENLGAHVDDARNQLLAQPDQVVRDFLHSQGYSEKEIQSVLIQKQTPLEKYPAVTCQNVSAIGRLMVVDMCIPQICN